MLAILILAAGNSNRLGKAKQLLPFQNTTLLGHTIQVAQSTQLPIAVVTGARQYEIENEIEKFKVDAVFNPFWQQGMSTSLQTGLHYLQTKFPNLQGLLVMVCDQPFINEILLNELIEKYSINNKSVASSYNNIAGVPAIITKDFFSEIEQLSGDKGARTILNNNNFEMVSFSNGTIDIDTPEEYDKFVQTIRTN